MKGTILHIKKEEDSVFDIETVLTSLADTQIAEN
jgi:hypothetical protein